MRKERGGQRKIEAKCALLAQVESGREVELFARLRDVRVTVARAEVVARESDEFARVRQQLRGERCEQVLVAGCEWRGVSGGV